MPRPDASTLAPELRARLAAVRLLSLDVDGVLTDGRLHYAETGVETKAFSTQDGHGLKLLAASGIHLAVITGRRSLMVTRRARELGIHHVHQGVADKAPVFETLRTRLDLPRAATAHVGDDLPDLPVFRVAGVALAPANVHPALVDHVDLVTTTAGGDGAVRDLCMLLMQARGTWDAVLDGS